MFAVEVIWMTAANSPDIFAKLDDNLSVIFKFNNNLMAVLIFGKD